MSRTQRKCMDVSGRGNKETEVALATLLRRHHIAGWRRGLPIFGKPDFDFPQLKLTVFVDGCFWHCCPKHSTRPANNRAFWREKLRANQRRDRLVNRTLRAQGWRVLRVWKHALKNKDAVIRRIREGMGTTGRMMQ